MHNAPMQNALRFAVFSFNRGTFLRNCIQSLETCVPDAAVTVFDDASDDPETRAVLDHISRRHQVVIRSGADSAKHGGLSANMQTALQHAGDGRVCFLQDDMQLVRPLTSQDDAAITRWFDHRPDAGFLHPGFLKGCNRDRDARITRFDPVSGCYLRDDTGRSVGRCYSDIFIADAARLRERNWQFATRESGNEQQAQRHFGTMGFMFVPFVMWLPLVPAYRGRVKTLAMTFAERRQGSGFHPLRILSAEAVEQLQRRTPDQLPVAEDHLQPVAGALPTPWHYHPLQKASLLRNLDRLERTLRRR